MVTTIRVFEISFRTSHTVTIIVVGVDITDIRNMEIVRIKLLAGPKTVSIS